MATTKRAGKKKLMDEDQIISIYMEQVLVHNTEPLNVYVFCKENGIEEGDFYISFTSIEALKQTIWIKFFENTIAIIDKDVAYPGYSDRNKLLTLYFTIFELLTLNRSYVWFTLKDNKQGLKNLKQLKELRNHFKEFIVSIIESSAKEGNEKLQKITKPVFAEGAWVQFLFILKFWIDDTSKGFEKTDIVIEKSVKASFDLMDTTPLESLLDLGKFLWKERAV